MADTTTVTDAIAEVVAVVAGVADRADLLVNAARRCAEAVRDGGSLVIEAHPERRPHAEHVAVEFVHPVITGKRAVPALVATPHARMTDPGALRLWLGPGATPDEKMPTIDVALVAGEAAAHLVDVTMVLTHHLLWELTHAVLDEDRPDDYLADLGRTASHGIGPTDVEAKVEQAAETIGTTLPRHATMLVDVATSLAETTDRVWTFGQGGSAADAALVAASLGGTCLSTNAAVVTALVNDIGPDAMYVRQVATHVRSEDLVIALTTSGASPAVLRGLAAATAIGARTVACTGAAGLADDDGSHTIATDVLDVDSDSIHRIQETHLAAVAVLAREAGRR